MDQYEALRRYNEQQRQERLDKSTRASDELARKKKEDEAQRLIREQERQAVVQRQAELQHIAQSQADEKKRRDEEARATLLAQNVEALRIADQQRQEAHQLAAQKIQEEGAQRAKSVSPIEEDFFTEWCLTHSTIELKRQYPIERQRAIGKKYRVDFAHLETKTVIELDGHQYHSSKQSRNRDYARHREIEDMGWTIIRFTGSEIFVSVASCVEIAYSRIVARQGR